MILRCLVSEPQGAEITEFAIMVAMGPEKMKDTSDP